MNLKNPLLVWDRTLVRIMWMSVHREKVSEDKQGFIERVAYLIVLDEILDVCSSFL